MKLTRNITFTLACIIIGAMLAWQFKSINYNQGLMTSQDKQNEEIISELIALQNTNKQLTKTLNVQQKVKSDYEKTKLGDNIAAKILSSQLDDARIQSGMESVEGKGVIITVDNGNEFDVMDSDIYNIINELNASGAQAISVNEERITALSEVRAAPPYIMINGHQTYKPFIIKAIGDPDKIRSSLNMAGSIFEQLKNYVDIKIEQSDDITIPKVIDDGSMIRIDLLTPVK